MKELSIEEKAKAYDEVREKIAIRFGLNVADEIFSPFEMSDDERIRKALIDGFKRYSDGALFNRCLVSDIVSWLEKQGEQKSIIIDVDKMVDEFAHTEVKGYGMPAMIEVDAYRKGVNDALRLSLNLEKQSEQNPTDEEMKTILRTEYEKGRADAIAEVQKSAWSEDDEQYLLVCKNALAKYQTTDKWDANIIYSWLENKLKSLKERYTWKPSDNELEVLRLAAEKDGACLMGLYEQLKKLKG